MFSYSGSAIGTLVLVVLFQYAILRFTIARCKFVLSVPLRQSPLACSLSVYLYSTRNFCKTLQNVPSRLPIHTHTATKISFIGEQTSKTCCRLSVLLSTTSTMHKKDVRSTLKKEIESVLCSSSTRTRTMLQLYPYS